MEQTPPQIGQTLKDVPKLAAALGLAARDFIEPGQVVSTGVAHLLVQVSDRSLVHRARPDAVRLETALREVGGQGCYLYSLDVVEPDSAAHARFFNPTVGVWGRPGDG